MPAMPVTPCLASSSCCTSVDMCPCLYQHRVATHHTQRQLCTPNTHVLQQPPSAQVCGRVNPSSTQGSHWRSVSVLAASATWYCWCVIAWFAKAAALVLLLSRHQLVQDVTHFTALDQVCALLPKVLSPPALVKHSVHCSLKALSNLPADSGVCKDRQQQTAQWSVTCSVLT